MEDGLIPEGEVDVRSITEVQPADLMGFTQWHFFAGIGGWSLALQLAGWATGRPVITGSCPCQPFSAAGKGKAEKDERHLWPEFARIIRGLRELGCTAPVMGEQVASKLGRSWLTGVRSDLEAMGNGFWAVDLCSASVGSPNIRQRLFWMAYTSSSACQRGTRGVLEEKDRVSTENRKLDGDSLIRYEHCGEAQSDRLGQSNSTVSELSERIRPGSDETEEAGPCSELDGSGESGSKRLGNSNDKGLQGRSIYPECAGERPAGTPVPFGRWSEFDIVHCLDGKSRRIPKASLESGIQCMVDGLQLGVDPLWHQGYPLAWQKIESRPAILKGIGNAINPWVAAKFIRSFMEDV